MWVAPVQETGCKGGSEQPEVSKSWWGLQDSPASGLVHLTIIFFCPSSFASGKLKSLLVKFLVHRNYFQVAGEEKKKGKTSKQTSPSPEFFHQACKKIN